MVIFILIGIIDSGLGAISVLNHLIKEKKYNNYILYLDYLYNPYGEKDEYILLERLKKAIEFLKIKNCEQIIVACNTLSVIAIKYGYTDLIIPIYIFKNEIIKYNRKNALLLATKYTINSNVYNFNNVIYCDLVSYIEGNNDKNIAYYLNLIKNYDVLLLGCTHYYLLNNKFKNKNLIDSGKLLANSIKTINNKLNINIYLTKYNKNIINHVMYHIHINKFKIKVIGK